VEHVHAIDSEAGAERYPPRAPLLPGEAAAVFAGGVAGALARSALEREFPVHAGGWPWATFAVNMAGAALLGYAVARLRRAPVPNPTVRAFVAAGLCGTLTTFSAMMLELLRMLDAGDVGLALGYSAASIAGGLAAVTIAGALGGRGASGRLAGGAGPGAGPAPPSPPAPGGGTAGGGA
jgi:fluoride exporter